MSTMPMIKAPWKSESSNQMPDARCLYFKSKLLFLSIFFCCFTLSAQQTAPSTVLDLYQQAANAKKDQNYSEYLHLAQQLSALAPSHPGIIFLLADAQILNGDLKSAKKNLLRAANLGISVDEDR